MFWTGLFSTLGLIYYTLVLPDEVFEINIDTSIEKLDTFYIPKLGSGGHYNRICRSYHYEMDDTIYLNRIFSFLPEVKQGRVCGDGYEMIGDIVILVMLQYID